MGADGFARRLRKNLMVREANLFLADDSIKQHANAPSSRSVDALAINTFEEITTVRARSLLWEVNSVKKKSLLPLVASGPWIVKRARYPLRHCWEVSSGQKLQVMGARSNEPPRLHSKMVALDAF